MIHAAFMNFLEHRILQEGIVKEGNILKVDSFLNHQIDMGIMKEIAHEFQCRFKDCSFNKILTIESSGIAIATLLGFFHDVPVVFAKKAETANCTDDMYLPPIRLPIDGRIMYLYLVRICKLPTGC